MDKKLQPVQEEADACSASTRFPPEIVRLILAYQACDPDDAEAMLYALVRERGPTMMLPVLFDLHSEAKMWASRAMTPELEAYALAAIEQLDDLPSGSRLRVHRAFKALQALRTGEAAMLLDRLQSPDSDSSSAAV